MSGARVCLLSDHCPGCSFNAPSHVTLVCFPKDCASSLWASLRRLIFNSILEMETLRLLSGHNHLLPSRGIESGVKSISPNILCRAAPSAPQFCFLTAVLRILRTLFLVCKMGCLGVQDGMKSTWQRSSQSPSKSI